MKYVFVFLFLIQFISLFSQNAYFAKDSTYNYGISIIEGTDFSNSLICRQKIGNRIIEYHPDEITEYGTGSGRVYISKELIFKGYKQKYFVERIVNGDISLYYLKLKKGKIFYLESDSSFLELINNNKGTKSNDLYKNVLKNYCVDSIAIKHTKFNKKRLSFLINRQNSGIIKPYPYFKYGIIFGVSATNINASRKNTLFYIENLKSKFDYNITFGAFMDIPLSLSYFSFHPELYYTQNAFTETIKYENSDIDFTCRFSSFNIPLLIRYTYPSKKIRPYVNLGVEYSYYNNYKQDILKTVYENNTVYIDQINYIYVISQNQMGFIGGLGLQYHFNFMKSLYFEFRLSKQYGIPDLKSVQTSGLHLITGLIF